MIQLTRLNNHPLVVNSDLIKFVEQSPDTVITLLSGEKIVVRESAPDVLDRVVQFRRSVLRGITVWSDGASAALPLVADGNAEGNDHPAGREKG
jgi:flagellar protein FlbD